MNWFIRESSFSPAHLERYNKLPEHGQAFFLGFALGDVSTENIDKAFEETEKFTNPPKEEPSLN